MGSDEGHGARDGAGPLNTDEQRQLVERFLAAFNAFDLDGVLATFHSQCRYQVTVAAQVVVDATGHEQLARQLLIDDQRSSSRKKTVLEAASRGDRLVLEISYSRVLSQPEEELRAGDVLSMEGVAEVSFCQQLIIEYREKFAG